jgi:hypothetical protein
MTYGKKGGHEHICVFYVKYWFTVSNSKYGAGHILEVKCDKFNVATIINYVPNHMINNILQ